MSTIHSNVDHAKNILQKLLDTCENEENCDVVIVAGTSELRIPAHRTILSAASDYFHDLFNSSMFKTTSKDIKMSSVDGSILQNLVKYCYTGSLEINEDAVVEMLNTAHMSTIHSNKDHAKNILQKLLDTCEENCDLVIVAGTSELRIAAHRTILSAASDYFHGMFNSSMLETTSKDIKLSSVDGSILQNLVKYCYIGSVEINEAIVVEMFKTAHMLLLHDVVGACADFLVDQLYPSNCLGFALLAECYHCDKLLQKAKQFCLDYFMEVIETEEFFSLNADLLCEIIASDDLCVFDEENVFNSVMSWIDYNIAERERYKDKLLALVRLPLLERSFLIEKVKPICTSTESQQIYMEAIACHLLPDREMTDKVKKRKTIEYVIAITKGDNNSMNINYFCHTRCKWKRWTYDLELRYEFGIAALEDDLFIVGGDVSGHSLNTTICLNLRTRTFKEVSPMLHNRSSCKTAMLNGFLYAVGGYNQSEGVLRSVERWNPKTNEWHEVAPMLAGYQNLSIAVLNEKLYVVGRTSNSATNAIWAECYDPNRNVWYFIRPTSGRLPHLVVENGFLYAIGHIIKRYNPAKDYWDIIIDCYRLGSDGCFPFRDKILMYHSDFFVEYNISTNSLHNLTTIRIPNRVICIMSFSGNLHTSEFTGI